MEITVEGNSAAVLPAECVSVDLTIGFTGPSRDQVVRDTAAASEVVRSLLDAVVADDGGSDARLTGLRTWTNIPYDRNGKPGHPQHVAQVRGSVTIKDLTRVAGFLGDLATTSGAQVAGVNWRLFDATRDRVQPEVLRGAFEDALQRARWIADAAGASDLKVASIEDRGGPTFAPPMKAMRMAMADSAPSFDLDPDDVQVAATLNVKFTAS